MRLRRCLVALPLLLTACGQQAAPESSGGGPQSALGFTVHAGAVQFPSDTSDWVPENVGLLALVPANGCVTGLGTFANGARNVAANWVGTENCTKLLLQPTPSSSGGSPVVDGPDPALPSGNALPSNGAVGWTDGSVIAAGTHFRRRGTDGITTLGALEGYRKSTAMVRTGDRLVAVGTGYPAKDKIRPMVWLSDDAGASSRWAELPQPAEEDPVDGPHTLAADGDNLLAANYSGRQVKLWSSTDRGKTWTFSKTPDLPPDTTINGIQRVGGEWMLFGRAQGARQPNVPVVLRGDPAKAWRLDDRDRLGDGGITAGTVDKAGKAILLGEKSETDTDGKRTRYCATVLVQDGPGWDRGELGCIASPPRTITTLEDGRVLIAGNQDLWLR